MTESKKPCVCPSLKDLPNVDIDGDGSFKYILVKVKCEHSGHNPVMVRGYKRYQSHTDILNELNEQMKPLVGVVSGGIIDHNPDNKTIHIHGTSDKYGKADHAVTSHMLKNVYPDYTITVGDD